MLESVWLALFVAGFVITLTQFVLERASATLSILNIAIWIAAAYGAQGIDVVDSGATVTSQETVATILALTFVVEGFLTLLIAIAQSVSGDTDAEGGDRDRRSTNPTR